MPTIARLTSAYATGIALVIGFALAPAATFISAAILLLAIVVADHAAVLRALGAQGAAFALAGAFLGQNAISARQHDCRNALRDGAAYSVRAVLLEEAGQGSLPIDLLAIGGVKCRGALRTLTPRGQAHISAGSVVRITAQWSRDTQARPLAAGAGILLASDIASTGKQYWLPRARGRIVTRIRALFGTEAPLAEALLVAQQGHRDRPGGKAELCGLRPRAPSRDLRIARRARLRGSAAAHRARPASGHNRDAVGAIGAIAWHVVHPGERGEQQQDRGNQRDVRSGKDREKVGETGSRKVLLHVQVDPILLRYEAALRRAELRGPNSARMRVTRCDRARTWQPSCFPVLAMIGSRRMPLRTSGRACVSRGPAAQ